MNAMHPHEMYGNFCTYVCPVFCSYDLFSEALWTRRFCATVRILTIRLTHCLPMPPVSAKVQKSARCRVPRGGPERTALGPTGRSFKRASVCPVQLAIILESEPVHGLHLLRYCLTLSPHACRRAKKRLLSGPGLRVNFYPGVWSMFDLTSVVGPAASYQKNTRVVHMVAAFLWGPPARRPSRMKPLGAAILPGIKLE